MMANNPDGRFEYVLDLENMSQSYGVWNFKVFRDRNSALSYAESLALNNPDMSVSVTIVPLGSKKNVLKS